MKKKVIINYDEEIYKNKNLDAKLYLRHVSGGFWKVKMLTATGLIPKKRGDFINCYNRDKFIGRLILVIDKDRYIEYLNTI